MLSEGVNRVQQSSLGVNRVFRTLSGDTPLPILQTPSAGHCLDTHGFRASKAPFLTLRVATPSGARRQAPLEHGEHPERDQNEIRICII